jgi:hypothetical protein
VRTCLLGLGDPLHVVMQHVLGDNANTGPTLFSGHGKEFLITEIEALKNKLSTGQIVWSL